MAGVRESALGNLKTRPPTLSRTRHSSQHRVTAALSLAPHHLPLAPACDL